MTHRVPGPRRGDDGFVLIGVIVFVLALTIIGISLFSLSSYEAYFLQGSLDREQAFQSALGDLERAKFVLTLAGARLRDVKEDLPPGTTAVAWQVSGGVIDSAGPVHWDPGRPIFIRVSAQAGSLRRTVEGWFTPRSTQDYYHQLITTSGGIDVRSVGVGRPSDRTGTVLLDGPVWETSGQDTTAWKLLLAMPRPTPVQTAPVVPVPAVGEFVAQHRNVTPPGISFSGDPIDTLSTYVATYQLAGGTSEPLYVTSDDVGSTGWSLYEGVTVDLNEVQVSGCAVWLFPQGAKFFQPVQITGTGSPNHDCLVMVAGRSGPDPDYAAYGVDSVGIWFLGGLQADIPVVLVSDGRVAIWQDNNYMGATANSLAGDLSIFARSVSLMGPQPHPFNNTMRLYRHELERLNERFLPLLLGHSALPNAGPASGRQLALQPGTWRASTP